MEHESQGPETLTATKVKTRAVTATKIAAVVAILSVFSVVGALVVAAIIFANR